MTETTDTFNRMNLIESLCFVLLFASLCNRFTCLEISSIHMNFAPSGWHFEVHHPWFSRCQLEMSPVPHLHLQALIPGVREHQARLQRQFHTCCAEDALAMQVQKAKICHTMPKGTADVQKVQKRMEDESGSGRYAWKWPSCCCSKRCPYEDSAPRNYHRCTSKEMVRSSAASSWDHVIQCLDRNFRMFYCDITYNSESNFL